MFLVCVLSFSPLFQPFNCFSPLCDLNDLRFGQLQLLTTVAVPQEAALALKGLETFWRVVVRRRKGGGVWKVT